MSKKTLAPCFYILLLLCLSSSVSLAQIILDDSVSDGNNFAKAAFRLWIGKETKQVRGVILLVPGSNGDGRDIINKPEWQALAKEHNMALVGCYFTDKASGNRAIEHYADVSKGSGQALLDALTRFATKSRHKSLAKAPLALWGMSAGGEVNYELACWIPEQIIAFIVNKGGVYYTALASEATRAVPGVFLTGEVDNPYRNNIVKGVFSINRRFGAKWMFAEEPGVGHQFAKSEAFALKYFHQIIPLRLPAKVGAPLAPLYPEGFVGELATQKVTAFKKDTRYKGVTVWLPNMAIADLWLGLMR